MKTITITLFLVASWLMPHVADAQTKPRKVTVFTDDYAGAKEELSVGKYDYMYLVRAGVATVKSIRIPAGMKVTLYDRDHFEGVSLVMTEDASINYLTAKGFARVSLSVSMIVEELPAATPVTAGPYVTIYKDDFAGASKNLIPGQYEYYELGDVDNDQLSSIKIPKGMKVTLYEHGGFKGRTLVLTKDTRAGFLVTSKFNDLTSSILVESLPDEPIAVKPAVVPAVVAAPVIVTEQTIPVVEEKINEPAEPIVYQGDYSGLSKSVGPGRYGIDQLGIGNNELSSVKVPRGFRVTLYDGDAFEGRSLVLTQDARAAFFAEKNFNNITSSLVVETIPMVTIYDGDYSGTSKSFEPGRYSVNELGIGNDQLSSLRVPRGLRVTLYDKDSFEGLMLVLTQDTGSDVIIDNGFNNITSSLTVEVIEKEIPMVTLFQDDFTGVSKKLPVGKYEPSQIGIANNSLSSIKIPRGLQVTLYEYGAQEGRAMTLRKDADMNFFMANGFNDITTSVVIEELFASEHVVTIYSDRFSGVSQSFTPGRYKLNDLTIGDNQISSVKVPAGMRVVMYEDDNFKGYSLTAESDKDLSASKVFNDRTSSIIVEDLFVPIVSPVADAPVAVPVVVAPVVTPVLTAPPVVQTPPCEMTSSQFENAFKAIEAKPFRDEMMSTALLATKDKCMNNLQIRRIAGLFSFEDQSLEFVKYAYELSSEKSEYYLLEDVFKFMSSKDEFTRFLKSK